MSQELKSSSEHQTHTDETTLYICSDCDKDILDHVYLVQRRRMRPGKETRPDGTIKYNLDDAVDPFHSGVILGPEQDVYCSTCYENIPTIQELINAHKNGFNISSENLD